jgi:formate hydrogenlyase subunit 3/multisubunit Na+/H+ antiporter MnhD subunit
VVRVLALSALGLGAFGMLGATRVSTFLTALVLSRGGIVFFALLGGVHGRMPLLLELATTASSLFLLAWVFESSAAPGEKSRSLSLDDLHPGSSAAARLALLVGAFSACSLPPFPGFVARFPLALAVASEGETPSLVAASLLVFLVGLGAMRVVSRAFAGASPESRAPSRREALLGLGLAALAMWFLGIYPKTVIELASRAVAEMF